MQVFRQPVCSKNNPATKICMSGCKQTQALMCQQQSCFCQIKHSSHLSFGQNINKFLQKISKDNNRKPNETLNNQILDIYQFVQKKIQIAKQQCSSKMIDEKDDLKLLKLFQDCNYSQITSEFVLKAISNSSNHQNDQINNRKFLLKYLELFQTSLQKVIEQTKEYVANKKNQITTDIVNPEPQHLEHQIKQESEKIQFKFIKDLCHQKYQIKQEKEIHLQKTHDLEWFAALLSPSLELIKNKITKFELRAIVPEGENLLIGLFRKDIILQQKFIWREKGAYLISTRESGPIYLAESDQNNQQSSFVSDNKTPIDIQFNPLKKTIMFKTKSQKSQQVQFKYVPEDKLYFGVAALGNEAKVRIKISNIRFQNIPEC